MTKPTEKSERTCPCGRLFVGGPHARLGPCCRWKNRRGGKAKKYDWTPERDQVLRDRYDPHTRGAIAKLAGMIGWPAWALKKRAAALGLVRPGNRRNWTPDEVTFLWNHAGTRSSHWIARQLKRPESSVVMKFKHMQISRRVRDGYTLRELVLCFGVDHHVIQRWLQQGKLPGRRRGTERERDAWAVTESDVLRFLTEHPMEFRLDRVDQFWFMDLITSGGLLRKAFADERALEAS